MRKPISSSFCAALRSRGGDRYGVRSLLASLALALVSAPLVAQEVAEYLGELRVHAINESTIDQVLKGLQAEKQANAAALEGLAKGDLGAGAIGSLMKCLSKSNDILGLGQCGEEIASEKSAQEVASGLDDSVFDGMKQRFWIYFDGTPAERGAQFSAAELAVIEKHRSALAVYREQFVSPHPDGGGG